MDSGEKPQGDVDISVKWGYPLCLPWLLPPCTWLDTTTNSSILLIQNLSGIPSQPKIKNRHIPRRPEPTCFGENQIVDENEQRTEQWLKYHGYTDIKYVENTNDQPPDFIVDNSIAVEVRRLNWMFGNKNRGLEGVEKPLEKDIRSGLESAGQPPHGCKIFVSCDLFHTDLPDRKTIVQEVKEAANGYVESVKESLRYGHRPPHSRNETSFGMSIRFDALANSTPNHFELLGVTAGIGVAGWVVADSIDSINRCIFEKTNKIKDRHDLYSEWWLILVEHNVHPTVLRQPGELQTVRNELTNTTLWSRISILSNLENVPHLNLI